VVGGLALAVTALPEDRPIVEEVPAAPQSFAAPAPPPPPEPTPVRLTREDRRGIDALLARFVPWAIARERPAAAYDLVTPALRVAATPAEWRSGNLPVMPYPADVRRSRGWTLNYAFPGRVNLDLLLQPRPGVKRGALAVNIELVERRGRWLVEGVVPVAVFATPGQAPRIIAQPDLGPLQPDAGEGRLNPAWALLLPLALIALPLLAAGAYGLLRPRARRS
jgi:hypothetical protein